MSDENLVLEDTQQVKIGKKQVFFTCFPNHLINDPTFSGDALSVTLYLESKAEGWQVRPFDIKKRFGFGDFRWRKISKELRERGILTEHKHSGGTELIFELSWKAKKDIHNPPVGFHTVQKPTRGKPTPLLKKEIIKDQFINKQQQSLFFLKIKERLIAQGIPMNDSTLTTWIKDFGEAKVASKVELLEQSQGVNKPEAWLLSALRNDYPSKDKSRGNYQNQEPARRNATVEETNHLIANVLSRPKADKAKALAEIAKLKRRGNAG